MWLLVITLCTSAIASFFLLRASADGKVADQSHIKYFERLLENQDMHAFRGEEIGYRWLQTDSEVEVVVPVDAGIRARDIRCDVTSRTLSLKCPQKDILQVCLRARHCPCNSSRSSWTLLRADYSGP